MGAIKVRGGWQVEDGDTIEFDFTGDGSLDSLSIVGAEAEQEPPPAALRTPQGEGDDAAD